MSFVWLKDALISDVWMQSDTFEANSANKNKQNNTFEANSANKNKQNDTFEANPANQNKQNDTLYLLAYSFVREELDILREMVTSVLSKTL